MSPMLRSTALFVALLLAAIAGRELRLDAQNHLAATESYEDVYYIPPTEWLSVFSLGHDEALADLLWMRALVYFGDEVVHRGAVRHVFDYCNAILSLDPDFARAYRWAATAGMYRPSDTSIEDLYTAVDFLERGARRFPDDGEMAWDLGASLTFELAPRVDDPREKDRLRERGVEHMQVAARLGAGPQWLVLTNATQLRRLGRTEQAIRHLEEMYSSITDAETKAQIEVELESLRGQAYAEGLRHTYEQLETQRQRDFPYVPALLFLHLGSRPPISPVAPYLEELEFESADGLPTHDDSGPAPL